MSYHPEHFKQLVDEFTKKEMAILDWKCKEYSPDEDRLQNFREVADFTGCRPSEVAAMYMMKHIQSIALAVRKGEYAWMWEGDGGEGLKQRIADARNYLLLLAACVDEEAKEGTD